MTCIDMSVAISSDVVQAVFSTAAIGMASKYSPIYIAKIHSETKYFHHSRWAHQVYPSIPEGQFGFKVLNFISN